MIRPLSLLLVGAALLHGYQMDMMEDIFELDLEALQNVKVTTVSKSAQSLNDAPAQVVVVTKEQIEDRGYRSLFDLLGDLPGFQTNLFSDSGIHSQIGVRGLMGTNYFKVLRDGIEVDQTDGEPMTVGMNYPLFGLERVEVLYGPASVVYGADALTCVVNMVTDKTPGMDAAMEYGEKGYRYVHLRAADKVGEGFLAFRAHYHQDQDYDLEKYFPGAYQAVDLVNSSGAVVQSAENRNFGYSPNATRSASLFYRQGPYQAGANYAFTRDSTLTTMTGANSTTNLFDPDSNLNMETRGLFFRYDGLGFRNFRSTTTVSYDATELLIDSYFINRYTDYLPAYKHSLSERYALEETLSGSLGRHTLTVGVIAESYESTPMSYDLPEPDLDAPATYHGSDVPVLFFKETWTNLALYLQDQFPLSEKLQVSAAGRYDKNSAYGDTFNPRLALIYRPGARLTSKLIYSRAFLAPSNYNKGKHYGNPLEPNTQNDGNT